MGINKLDNLKYNFQGTTTSPEKRCLCIFMKMVPTKDSLQNEPISKYFEMK